jgi:Na+/melibiose symporter-like transporter
MWFSYLLVYFHQILKLDAAMAGYLLLIGQLTDGLATPIVGIESDRVGLLGRLYGKRKSWHLFGTVCVVLSFIFIFTPG